MREDDFYNDENKKAFRQAIKDIEGGQGKEHDLLDEDHNAMGLTLDQRRELMDRIMEEAWNVAREATPDCYNIYADTDEADAIREKQFQIVIEKMLELKKRYGFPIAKYDRTTKRAYIEYADGSREYFD